MVDSGALTPRSGSSFTSLSLQHPPLLCLALFLSLLLKRVEENIKRNLDVHSEESSSGAKSLLVGKTYKKHAVTMALVSSIAEMSASSVLSCGSLLCGVSGGLSLKDT